VGKSIDQIGTKIQDIEKKHVERYQYAFKHIKVDDDVLDAACGCGYGSNILARKARHVTGVDYSQQAIDYAQKHWHRKNITYLKYDLTKDTFGDLGHYDVIVSFETIEHLMPPILQTIIKFKNILKKGGYLILSHPEKEPSKFPGAFSLGLTFHFHFNLKGTDITEAMQFVGFEIIDDWYQEGRWKFPYHIILGKKK